MDHEGASLLLSDLLANRLAPGVATEVRAHLQACSICTQVFETMTTVEEELRVRGRGRVTHPAAEEIVAYVAEPGASAHASVAAHVQTCESCKGEVELLRRTPLGRARFSLKGWIRDRGLWEIAGPVFVASTLGLVYPAYRGVVELPETRRSADDALAQIESLSSEQASLRASLAALEARVAGVSAGGGAGSLVLASPMRGAAGPQATQVRLAPEQVFLPLAIEYSPPAEFGTDAELEVTVVAEASGTVVWRHAGPASRAWNGELEWLTYLVPGTVLPPGSYRAELRGPGQPDVLFSGRFEVLAPNSTR